MSARGPRISAGSLKGQVLKTLPGMETRPTLARVKKSIFSCLGELLEEDDALDLFAGTGNLGIEALSRGARSVLFVDNSPRVVRVLRENLDRLRLLGRTQVWLEDAFRALVRLRQEERRFHLIFADPPYESGLPSRVLSALSTLDVLEKAGCLILEHSVKSSLPSRAGRLCVNRTKRLGDTMISLYSVATDVFFEGGVKRENGHLSGNF